jgi:hypothetical protein
VHKGVKDLEFHLAKVQHRLVLVLSIAHNVSNLRNLQREIHRHVFYVLVERDILENWICFEPVPIWDFTGKELVVVSLDVFFADLPVLQENKNLTDYVHGRIRAFSLVNAFDVFGFVEVVEALGYGLEDFTFVGLKPWAARSTCHDWNDRRTDCE